MPRRRPNQRDPQRNGEAGFTVVSAMIAMAITLVMVTWFANLFMHRYAQGVIRQATDQGARAWAVSGGTPEDCQQAAADVMADLLDGPLAAEVDIVCNTNGTTVTATATGSLTALPPLPDATINTGSTAVMELEDDLLKP
jgi:hypothetical protein